MRAVRWGWFHIFSALLFCLLPIPAAAQQAQTVPNLKDLESRDKDIEVPDKFDLDRKTAARLRPGLLAQSTVPGSRYANGRRVFDKLVEQINAQRHAKYLWELRIVKDGLLNAYSSPDGTIYVQSGLADLAGSSSGLWAAVLSHEMAHVVRRDWARRYLYEESLRERGGLPVVLGDPGLPSAGYTDSAIASESLARFCRQLELDADLESLMLMARAGYHPDFVPALHHLLHAQSAAKAASSMFAMHPCWEERDRELDRAYVAASIEFEHRWPETYASPGGNPPTLVFADKPSVKRVRPREWEIRVPMRCQNLVGAVEVVLETYAGSSVFPSRPEPVAPDAATSSDEVRELTGCTSPKTTVTFKVSDVSRKELWAEVFVLDGQGAVLSRGTVPRLP